MGQKNGEKTCVHLANTMRSGEISFNFVARSDVILQSWFATITFWNQLNFNIDKEEIENGEEIEKKW